MDQRAERLRKEGTGRDGAANEPAPSGVWGNDAEAVQVAATQPALTLPELSPARGGRRGPPNEGRP
ncbi:hypothetical protein [Gemmata sp.]|uniref:hypothetical protein n=1 Tax=Gemmata sp. TaxID=1914242 RepID=UPI003F72E994